MNRRIRFNPARAARLAAQKGFTLLELVVVIVIVGILAAVAVPKFTSLASDARGGVIKGVAGSMASANIAVYAAAVSQGATGATGTVNACGQAALQTVYGYAKDAQELAKCVDLNPSTDFTVTTGAIQHSSASTKTTCQAAYTAPTGAGVQPAYTTTVSDCS